jgi:hypothetical protein
MPQQFPFINAQARQTAGAGNTELRCGFVAGFYGFHHHLGDSDTWLSVLQRDITAAHEKALGEIVC